MAFGLDTSGTSMPAVTDAAATATGAPTPLAPVPTTGDLPPDPLADLKAKGAKAGENLLGVGLRKEAELEGAEGRFSRFSDAYAHRMQQAIDAEGATARDLKPFETQKELAKHQTSLWEAFGSPGFLVAMFGSAFSARPMNSALFAGGAAMAALKQNDEDAYNKAMEAWKLNTDLTVKRLNAEHQEYADIASLANHNIAEYGAKLRGIAAKYENQQVLAMWEAGLFPEVQKMLAEMPEQEAKLRKAQEDIEESDLKRRLTMESLGATPEERKKAMADPMNLVKAARRAEELIASTKEEGTPEQQLTRQFNIDHQNATIDDRFAFYEKMQRAKALQHTGSVGAQEAERIQELMMPPERGGMGLTWEQAKKYVTSESRPDTKASMQVERIKHFMLPKEQGGLGLNFEQATKKEADDTRAGQGPISEETARVAAARVMRGDMSALQGLGWGNVGSENRSKVNEMITQVGKEQGLKPDEIGKHIANARLAYIGEMRGASALGQREALLTAGIAATQSTIPRVLQTSKEVSRTKYADINQILLAARTRTGDQKVVRYGVALETLVQDYARSFGTSSVVTDARQDHARDLLQKYWSQGQIEAAVDQMMSELKSQRIGILSGTKEFLESFEERPENADAILKIPIYVQTPEESHRLPKGQIYVTPDSKVHEAGGPD